MSRFVDNIPIQFQPKSEQHIEHSETIRILKNNECDINSFLPTFIERNPNSFFSDFVNPSDYSLSLFDNIDNAVKRFNPFSPFWRTHRGFAKGPTSINRGISLKANSLGHIDYYLYDTFNNNPCYDFVVVVKD